MAQIPELIAAKQAYDEHEEKLQPMLSQIEALQREIAALSAQIEALRAPYKQAYDAAVERQSRTLTKWVKGFRESGTRYTRHLDGTSHKCWNGLVWLRPKGNHENKYRYHLRGVDYTDTDIDSRPKTGDWMTLPLPSWEEMARVADERLIAQGFILTDLDPDFE